MYGKPVRMPGTTKIRDGKAHSLAPTKSIRHPVIKIVITHCYAARDAQYRLFILISWTQFHLEPLIQFLIALVHALIIDDDMYTRQ